MPALPYPCTRHTLRPQLIMSTKTKPPLNPAPDLGSHDQTSDKTIPTSTLNERLAAEHASLRATLQQEEALQATLAESVPEEEAPSLPAAQETVGDPKVAAALTAMQQDTAGTEPDSNSPTLTQNLVRYEVIAPRGPWKRSCA